MNPAFLTAIKKPAGGEESILRAGLFPPPMERFQIVLSEQTKISLPDSFLTLT